MQRRFWAGAVRPFGFPSLNVLRLPSKRLRNGHLAWGDFASKLSFERTIARERENVRSPIFILHDLASSVWTVAHFAAVKRCSREEQAAERPRDRTPHPVRPA